MPTLYTAKPDARPSSTTSRAKSATRARERRPPPKASVLVVRMQRIDPAFWLNRPARMFVPPTSMPRTLRSRRKAAFFFDCVCHGPPHQSTVVECSSQGHSLMLIQYRYDQAIVA
jgi:hypothetical protein